MDSLIGFPRVVLFDHDIICTSCYRIRHLHPYKKGETVCLEILHPLLPHSQILIMMVTTPLPSLYLHRTKRRRGNDYSSAIQKGSLIHRTLVRRNQLLKMAQHEYSRQLSQYTQDQLHRIPTYAGWYNFLPPFSTFSLVYTPSFFRFSFFCKNLLNKTFTSIHATLPYSAPELQDLSELKVFAYLAEGDIFFYFCHRLPFLLLLVNLSMRIDTFRTVILFSIVDPPTHTVLASWRYPVWSMMTLMSTSSMISYSLVSTFKGEGTRLREVAARTLSGVGILSLNMDGAVVAWNSLAFARR